MSALAGWEIQLNTGPEDPIARYISSPMNIPLLLLALALAAGTAWYLGRVKGLAAFLALLVVGSGVAYVASTQAALAIGFALAFALPYVLGALALGVLG